jgi:serine-type D-Ala-D-Ala carboxypeptidase
MGGGVRVSTKTFRPVAAEDVGMSASGIQRVVARAHEWMKEGLAPALALFAARRGGIVLHEAFGRLTPDLSSPPVPLDANFPLASITKLFTATVLMGLVEEGRVGLNRPVSGYIPEFHGEGKDRVLVRHLLTHTSGIGEEDLEKYASERKGKVTVPPTEETLHPLLQEYLTLRYDCPLSKQPGEEMSYADFNFDLLAEIIRRTSRTALDRFAQARLFQPLGMNGTFYCRADAPPERRVRRVEAPASVSDPWSLAMEKEHLAMGSALGVSTARDLGIFGQMFLNGGEYGGARVLSPTSVATMTRNQIPGVGATFLNQKFAEASWGFGWSVHGEKNGSVGGLYSAKAYEHWGNGGAYLWVDPSRELVGVYLSSAPLSSGPEIWEKHWRTDIFADMITAAVVDS